MCILSIPCERKTGNFHGPQAMAIKKVIDGTVGHIHYSHIRDIFVPSPCAVGFALRNVRDIYILQMALGVFGVIVAR